jgi:3',5'-cyclic AMP phosphodiesterase CpdA
MILMVMALMFGLSPSYGCAQEDRPIRFAVIGDFGRAGRLAKAVADLVKSWEVDFIITTGDNNYPNGGADTIDANIGQYYREFIHPYVGGYGDGATKNRFFPTLGNHDWMTPCAQPYLDYFTLPGNEHYYTFTMGPVQFFALDSDSREPDGIAASSVQAKWLKAELAASHATWKLVYMHHPPYSSGKHRSSRVVQWPYQQWGASAVLAGHDHTYERIVVDGLPYFVVGTGGANLYAFGKPVAGSQVRYNTNHGAMRVEADAGQITFEFFSITEGGKLVDPYTLTATTSSAAAPNQAAANTR